MKSFLSSLLVFFVGIIPSTVIADPSEKIRLIPACIELVKIYNDQYEKSVLVEVMASPVDLFQAGFCMGIVKSAEEDCDGYTWYQIAGHIAGHAYDKSVKEENSEILNSVCKKKSRNGVSER